MKTNIVNVSMLAMLYIIRKKGLNTNYILNLKSTNCLLF